MNDFMKNLTSSSWWLSVIVIGIVVNLLSTQVQHLINFTKRLFFKKIADDNLRRKKQIDGLINYLIEHPDKLQIYIYIETKLRIRLVFYIVISMCFMLFILFIPVLLRKHFLISMFLHGFLSFFAMFSVITARNILSKARKIEKAISSFAIDKIINIT